MMSATKALKLSAERTLIERERKKIMDAFAASPQSKHRAVTKIAKIILLNGPYLLNGRSRDVKARSLGIGVYELSLVIRTREDHS